MKCKECGETALKQKWEHTKRSKKYCEHCLPDGSETPYVQYTMIYN